MSTIESTTAPSIGVRGAVDWYDDRWYVTPFSNSLGPDKSRNARGSGLFPLLFSGKSTGSSGGLALGKSVSPEWNVELRAGWDELDARKDSRSGKNWFNESGSTQRQIRRQAVVVRLADTAWLGARGRTAEETLGADGATHCHATTTVSRHSALMVPCPENLRQRPPPRRIRD